MFLQIIPYIASLWAFLILFKRLQQFNTSKIRKTFAFIFASSLILFYLGQKIYTGYVFKTYGVKKHTSHHQHKATHK